MRALVSGAAATVKLNDPDPVADVPPVAVIHEASERPVHAHELPVEIVIEPVPPAGSVMPIQGAFVMTVQLQLDAAATSNVPLPPATPKVSSSGLIVTVQLDRPACVTVWVWPATESVPVRDAASEFAATL